MLLRRVLPPTPITAYPRPCRLLAAVRPWLLPVRRHHPQQPQTEAAISSSSLMTMTTTAMIHRRPHHPPSLYQPPPRRLVVPRAKWPHGDTPPLSATLLPTITSTPPHRLLSLSTRCTRRPSTRTPHSPSPRPAAHAASELSPGRATALGKHRPHKGNQLSQSRGRCLHGARRRVHRRLGHTQQSSSPTPVRRLSLSCERHWHTARLRHGRRVPRLLLAHRAVHGRMCGQRTRRSGG